jgi:hypothetical protein
LLDSGSAAPLDNGIAFELRETGQIERLAPEGLREVLSQAVFNTGDDVLDVLLERARAQFLNPNPAIRRQSLEALWDGVWQVWKVPSQGGTTVQVTRGEGFEGRESPDGKYVYYVKEVRGGAEGPGIWKIPVGGGEETRLLDQGRMCHWVVALRGIYFVVPSSSCGPTVKFFNFTTRRITQIAVLPEDTRLDMNDPAFTVSPDAGTILYGQTIPPGNVMVVENFR